MADGVPSSSSAFCCNDIDTKRQCWILTKQEGGVPIRMLFIGTHCFCDT